MFYNNFHGVRAFIYNKQNELLLLKRSDKDEDDAGLWDVPGGRIEDNENSYQAVLRETFEETGLYVSVLDVIGFIVFKDKFKIIVFKCKSQHTNVNLNEEHSDFQWIDPKMIKKNELGTVLKEVLYGKSN